MLLKEALCFVLFFVFCFSLNVIQPSTTNPQTLHNHDIYDTGDYICLMNAAYNATLFVASHNALFRYRAINRSIFFKGMNALMASQLWMCRPVVLFSSRHSLRRHYKSTCHFSLSLSLCAFSKAVHQVDSYQGDVVRQGCTTGRTGGLMMQRLTYANSENGRPS